MGGARRKPAPRMQKRRELRTAVALAEASVQCTGLWRLVEGGTATCGLRLLTGYSDTVYPGLPGWIRNLEAQQPC